MFVFISRATQTHEPYQTFCRSAWHLSAHDRRVNVRLGRCTGPAALVFLADLRQQVPYLARQFVPGNNRGEETYKTVCSALLDEAHGVAPLHVDGEASSWCVPFRCSLAVPKTRLVRRL